MTLRSGFSAMRVLLKEFPVLRVRTARGYRVDWEGYLGLSTNTH
jgi:hypothetical protein